MPSICLLYPLPYQPDPAFWFQPLHRQSGAVLLDSGRPVATRGRYDLFSAWPVEMLQAREGETGQQFFERCRQGLRALGPAGIPAEAELPFAGGLLGYLSYDFGRRLEAVPAHAEEDLRLPDARLGLYDWAFTTDHHRRKSWLVFHPQCAERKRRTLVALFEAIAQGGRVSVPASWLSEDGATSPRASGVGASAPFTLLRVFQPTIGRETYRQAIARVHQYIRAGDCYQVNYTQRFESSYRGDPWQAYETLRRACATPFAGYLNLGADDAILSLSPERFLKLQQGQIETRPIKGTRPRGSDAQSDQALARQLCDSAKDRAENLMIVDLLRNDIGRSSRIGSVHVPELFSLESYPNVHHLVSSIRAQLAPGLDAFDLLAGSFPGGSITGAPKIRAMEIIDELEPHRRSIYCGSLLYIDVRGEMDSSITIRSMLARGGRISCWAGGGIVLDSDWEEEYQESLDKVGVLLRALAPSS